MLRHVTKSRISNILGIPFAASQLFTSSRLQSSSPASLFTSATTAATAASISASTPSNRGGFFQQQRHSNNRLNLASLEHDDLVRELDRFGRHKPDPDHTRAVIEEMRHRSNAVNVRPVREAITLAYRCGLYNLAVDLYLERAYCATDIELQGLGLPEDVIDCAALCSVGDPVRKLLAVTRTVEATLRKSPSVDVVAGIEFSLFRALWRMFVCLKKLRLATPAEERRPGDELEITEAARRIFDLILIVNNKVLRVSSGNLQDDSTAFRRISRQITLCVLYSDATDDGEADFFRIAQKSWLQADVSSAPAGRYVSLIRTCGASRRHDIATEYFDEYETAFKNVLQHAFGNSNNKHRDAEQQKQALSIPQSLVAAHVGQLELILHAYWSLLNHCGEFSKVTRVLDRYLVAASSLTPTANEEATSTATSSAQTTSTASPATRQLSPSVIAVAMRAVGETREAGLAARAMASLLKSCVRRSRNKATPLKAGEELEQAEGPHDGEHEGQITRSAALDATTATTTSNSSGIVGGVRPPSSYEMATCLLALARCGHPTFHDALETCLQEELIEVAPLRVAELSLQYALNDPVDCLRIIHAEARRCSRAGFDIRTDMRCASLILQILLRADDARFLSVFDQIESKMTTGGKTFSPPRAWVDWLIIWSQRRRYQLSNEQRRRVLSVVAKQAPSSPVLARQAELIKNDLERASNESTMTADESVRADDDEVFFSDPRCTFARRKGATRGLRLSHASSCVAESFLRFASTQQTQSTPLEEQCRLRFSATTSSAIGDAAAVLADLTSMQQRSGTD